MAWHGSTHGIDEAADWIGLANLTVSKACATKTVYGASRVPLLLARCSLHCTARRARQAHALAPPEPARQSTRCRHRMVTSPAAKHHCCRFKQKRLPKHPVTAGCELHRRLRALQQVLHERRPQFAEMKRTIMIMLGWISRGHSCLQQPQLVEICLGTFARQGAWTNMIHATDTCDVSAKLPRWWSWISRSCFASSSSLSSILVW